MRGLCLIALIGACTFTPGQAASPGGDPVGGNQGGMAPDAAPIARPACDLSDNSIQLCLDFETPQLLGLDSSAGHHDAVVTSATPVTRATSEQAVAVVMGSSIDVAETPALDIQNAITYELWLSPTAVPASGHYQALDNSGQYAINLEPDGKVRCSIAGKYAESHDPIPLSQWTHVACTYDRYMITIYVNGDASDCYQTSGQISTTGTTGTAIGEPFIGSIDNVHVMSREAFPWEICGHAGRNNCDGYCNPS